MMDFEIKIPGYSNSKQMLNSLFFDLGTKQRVSEVYKSTSKTTKKILILQPATQCYISLCND